MRVEVTETRWHRIEELFAAVMECEPSQRQAFLSASCTDDEALRGEVESLLRADEASRNFLEAPMFDEAVDLIAQDEESKVPKEIGPYLIEKEIGRGGMGTVYLAVRGDPEYRRQVALKVVKRGMDTDFILQRFRTERRMLAEFDHPNIARLWDGGATPDGLPYFALEYVDGLPIDKYCDAHRLRIRDRFKLFLAVCSAVQYAHQRLVIHRDLKPSNILVTTEGIPKLLDFGIAKLLTPDNELITLTALPLRVMTPEYASPEQLRGEVVTTTTDVYSLGVILYQLLSGQRPYNVESRSPEQVVQTLTKRLPERLSRTVNDQVAQQRGTDAEKLRRGLRGDLETIVAKAMHQEAARRYASVAELAADIQRHLDGLPVAARRDTFRYRAGKFIGRNKLAVAIAMVALVSLIGGSIAVAWEAHVARRAQLTAEHRLEEVRKVAHSMLFDYNDALAELHGAGAVRVKLMKDASQYLDSLASDAHDEPKLLDELAGALERLGDIQALPPKIGQIADALESYRKAVRIRERFAQQQPRDAHTQAALANTYSHFANALWQGDDTAGAVAIASKALAIQQQLAAAAPDDIDAQFALTRTLSARGEMFQEQGHAELCNRDYAEADRVAEALATRHPENPTVPRMLYIVRERIVEMLLFTGQYEAALKGLQECLAEMEKGAAENPNDLRYQHNAALAWQRIGETQEMLGDERAAATSFAKGVEIFEHIAEVERAASLERMKLAEGLFHFSVAQAKLGDLAPALATSRRSLGIREEVAQENPADSWARTFLIQSLAKTANLSAQSKDVTAATDTSRKVQELLARSPADPTNMSQAGFRADAWRDLGDVQFEMRDAKRARESYQKGLDIWNYMKANDLLFAQDAGKIDELRAAIARCDL